MLTLVVIIVSFLLVLAGLLGSVLPFLPGPPLAWLGLLLYGWFTHFEDLSVWALVIFGALTALSVVLDAFAPALGARGYKASRAGTIGAIVGGLLGLFLLGPFGILLGPPLGAFLGEYWHTRERENALRVAWGSFVGFLLGTSAKAVVVLSMLVYFIIVLV